MNHVVVTTERAFARLAGLPQELLDEVEAALRRLGDDPQGLARKAPCPYPPKGQIYPFHCDYQGTRYHFVTFFYFGEDKRTLVVYDVTVTTVRN